MTVTVEKSGLLYECRSRGKEPGFYCGACAKGVVYPVKGDMCMNCGAVVKEVG